MKKKTIYIIILIIILGIINIKIQHSQEKDLSISQVKGVLNMSHIENIKHILKINKVLPQPGLKTIDNLLMTAKEPVGKTMYVWGGGWNEEDTGAGDEAVSIGISQRWVEFANMQEKTYNYKNTSYQIHDGLDCSGYLGWVIYNVMNNTNNQGGYVMSSSIMAKTFAVYGWGDYISSKMVHDWKAGDVMSMEGHTWISLGMCEDGSVVLFHSSPPGVRISGTKLCNNEKSQAVELAEKYMKKYYPKWYERYPECAVDYNYLTTSHQMRWNEKTLTDDNHLKQKNAEEILRFLYD